MIALVTILLLVLVFCITPITLARNTLKAFLEVKSLDANDNLRCVLPIYNTYYTRKASNGTATFTGICLALSVALIVLRFFVLFFLYKNETLMIYSSVGIIIGLVLLWVTTGYVYYSIAKICNTGAFIKIFCFIMPPVAAYWTGKAIIPVVNRIVRVSRNFTLD